MVVVLPRERVAVTAAPGAGSTSLRAWALARPHAVAVPARDVRRKDGTTVVDAKHATVGDLARHGLWGPEHVATVDRVVTTTRDPFEHWHAEWFRSRTRWSRELDDPSSWVVRVPGVADRVRRAVALGFDAWLAAELGPAASAGRTMHLNAGHVGEADVVLRLERLAEDVRRHLGIADGPGHHNATAQRGPAREAYTARGRALVEAVHAPDLARFGYCFAAPTRAS